MATKAATKPATKTATKTTTTRTTTKAAPAKTVMAPDPAPTTTAATTASSSGNATTSSIVPIVDRSPWGILALVLGILMLGGVGTIIAATQDKRRMTRDIVFGVLQIIVPFAGQVWGLVWGILIFVKGNK